ncbi:hypothetical protein C0J52_18268 [Blattella germanica]|nr:hypothetical protein C0J52_18268 [Blattella germanica]
MRQRTKLAKSVDPPAATASPNNTVAVEAGGSDATPRGLWDLRGRFLPRGPLKPPMVTLSSDPGTSCVSTDSNGGNWSLEH